MLEYNEQVISASLLRRPTVTLEARQAVVNAAQQGDSVGLVRIIASWNVLSGKSDLLIHLAFHTCLRTVNPLLASDVVAEALQNRIRIRQKTFAHLMNLLLISVEQGKPVSFHGAYLQPMNPSPDTPPDPKSIRFDPLRSALQLFLSAREEHRIRSQSQYQRLLCGLVKHKEYEAAARLFSLVVQDQRRIRTRHLQEQTPFTRYLASEDLQPDRELFIMLSEALQVEITTSRQPDPYTVASRSQAVACLAFLVQRRHLPFWDFISLINALFDFMYFPPNTQSIRIPLPNGDAKLTNIRDYVHRTLLYLIRYPPSKPVPEKLARIDDPMMPPLSWATCAALLRGVRRRWRNEGLADEVATQMAQRFLGPNKTAQDLRTLYDTPARRKSKKLLLRGLVATQGEEGREHKAEKPPFQPWVSLQTRAEQRATRQFQEEIARAMTELQGPGLQPAGEDAGDELHSDAVDWLLDSGGDQKPDHTSKEGFDDDDASELPGLAKSQFSQLVSSWHGTPKKNS